MKNIFKLAWLMGFLLIFAGYAAASPSSNKGADGERAVAGRILVQPRPGADMALLQESLRPFKFFISRLSDRRGIRIPFEPSVKSAPSPFYLLVSIPRDMDPEKAAQVARGLPGVKDASPDYLRFLFYQPNDPDYSEKQLNFVQIGMERVWNVTFGDPLIVAVLDTGYRTLGLTDGVANLLPGYDFESQDEDPTDNVGHGTIVANVIAEATDNGIACAGMAPNTHILPVKVFPDDEGGAVDSDIIDGIHYAVDQGAVIINMSFGGGDDAPLLEQALVDAREAGVFLVAATGNDGEDFLAVPSRYDPVFAVGSCGKHGFGIAPERSDFSNYGQGLDIVAPGDNIIQEGYTLDYGVGLYSASGTSVSAPHVSAAAALLISLGGVGDPDTLAQALRDSAVKGELQTGTGWDEELGYGELNVPGAIALYDQPLPNSPPIAEASYFLDSEWVPANVTLDSEGSTDPDGNILSYTWVLEDGSERSSRRFEREILTPGEYTATVTVTDSEGESDSDTVAFSVGKAAKREEDDGGGGCGLSRSPSNGLFLPALMALLSGWVVFRRRRL